MISPRTEPTDTVADREVASMGSEPRHDTVKPLPTPPVPDVGAVGDLSLFLGLLSILSIFVTAMPFESMPFMIFVVGLTLAVASFWLAARAMRAPGGSRGRGTAGFGIAFAIVGIAFSLFGWAMTSIMANDSIL
jgi:hypothetical protein